MFLAIKFDLPEEKGWKKEETLMEVIKGELRVHGVECATGEEIAPKPPPADIRCQILASDGLLAVITSTQSNWVENEIGMAYAADRPVYALIEQEVDIKIGEGMLPTICKYKRSFRRTDKPSENFELKKNLAEIARDLTEEAKLHLSGVLEITAEAGVQTYGVNDPHQIIASTDDHASRVTISLAVRPRQVPHGDEVVSIYIPPQFDLSSVMNTPERYLLTNLGDPVQRILIGRTAAQGRYPCFWYVKVTLTFPEAASWLEDGWFTLKLSDVRAPRIAGIYRFYGTDDILVVPATAAASPFDFHPITVNGEVTPASLSGTLFLDDSRSLILPAVVRAIGTAVDPWQKGSPSTGRPVEAICYLSGSQRGRYAIAGLAPGVYTVYAGVLGYSQTIVAQEMLITEPKQLDGHVSLTWTQADMFTTDHRQCYGIK